jgi:hypothetical protein
MANKVSPLTAVEAEPANHLAQHARWAIGVSTGSLTGDEEVACRVHHNCPSYNVRTR